MMDTRRMGRRTVFTLMAAAVGALATAAGPLAPAARATAVAMDKAKFKEGCEQGGGSYVENRDGSFQCNLRDGGQIKCPNATSQCTYTPKLVLGGDVVGGILDGGAFELPTDLDLGITPVVADPPVRERRRRRRRHARK